MALDPAILKIRWGATDAQMPLVEQVANQAQALCESYTGRLFDLGPDALDFPHVAYSFQVRRYPIVSVEGVWLWQLGQVPAEPDPGAAIAPYRMDRAKGLIWPGVHHWRGVLHIEYTGGYDPWPHDLIWAVTQAADIVWRDTPGGGAAPGSAGGAALGVVKRISVVGVYSAEIGETGGGDGEANGWGVLPAEVTDVLDRYRAAAVVGIG